MKLKIFSGLMEKAKAHKLIALAVCVALLCGLACGGWFGWQEYERRQTAAFAIEKMKQALVPVGNANALAHMVNMGALGRELAQAVSESFPFYLAGADQQREIGHRLQNGLLKRLQEVEKSGSMFPDDASERAKLEKPFELLPPDFITQIASSLQVRQTDSHNALLTAKVAHPQLDQTFTLMMEMRKTPEGWVAQRLLNARELVAQLRAALITRHIALRNVVESKNAATAKQMNERMPIMSCSADAGALSDGKTVVLIIHAIARNRGDAAVNNFNLDATVTGRNGQPILHRYLNAAKPVAPGEDFNHRWSVEMDRSNPVAAELLRAGPLQCRASWQTLSLGKPLVLHIEEVPNPDIPCEVPGHNHPQGFCVMPLFKR